MSRLTKLLVYVWMVLVTSMIMVGDVFAQAPPPAGAPPAAGVPVPANAAGKAAVRVNCPAPGAGIYVDNEMVGTCPMANDILVDPGSHTFQAKRGQQRTEWVSRQVVAGQRQVITLGPLKGGKFGAAYSVAIALGVIGLFGVITGSAFGGVSINKMEEHKEKADALLSVGGGCGPAGPASQATCRELAAIRDSNSDFVIAGGIVGGVSGALLVAAVAWGVTLENSGRRFASVPTITPILTPNHQGLAVTARF